jgi:hypothetical protein
MMKIPPSVILLNMKNRPTGARGTSMWRSKKKEVQVVGLEYYTSVDRSDVQWGRYDKGEGEGGVRGRTKHWTTGMPTK